ncbi:MAG: type II toxin-antitoxin system PemK/MazF family toxin [Peptococcaceae bacterium]|nr:type II toxin-antitoxin system PemK/MazF family toxin [Peptococcaceae bacterium]
MFRVKRGDIYFADLSPVIGSEQGGVRPVLIIQNDVGNQHSPTTIVAAITGQIGKAKIPTHVPLAGSEKGLSKNSMILVEQVRTIDKKRLKERICSLDKAVMDQVDKALIISMGLSPILCKEEE